VETGKNSISIMPTGSQVVVSGDRRGSQKIFINHEKAEFQAEILVFVVATDESVLYITTKDNVITMFEGGETKMISAQLVNGNITDKNAFTFTVVEGNDVIAILSANETCNINAIKEGTALIRIWHPKAEYDLDVRIIVMASQQPYIVLDKMFQLIMIGESTIVTASIEDGGTPLWVNEYEYSVEKPDVISVIQTNNQFHITGKNAGSSVLSISNRKVKYAREMLVVVVDPAEIPPDDYYITTSQNIVQLDLGMTMPFELKMLLVNGNEGDRNDFEWVVEDGRIINVESPHTNKPVVHRSQMEIRSVFEALAYITPLKVGQTKITVAHPKAKAMASVIVKVYPRGTFDGQSFILGRMLTDEEKADKEGEGLIKIDTTKEDKKIQLAMKSGEANNVGDLDWIITPVVRATARDLHGLENYLTGHQPAGVGKITVSNQNLKYPYEAVLMVGTTEELSQMSVLYADNLYHNVAVGQSVSVQIKDSNGIFQSGDNFILEDYDRSLLSAVMIQSRLLLQGLKEGNALITVKHKTNAGVVPVTLTVYVEPAEITIGRPYTITGPTFFGMYVGQERASIKISMDNATELEKGRVQWESKNNAAVRITGNGLETFASAFEVGQSNVIASHDRAQSEGKTIVVYVVSAEKDLESAVVLGIEKQHWLLKPGEEVLMSLITNADPQDPEYGLAAINWGGNDPDIVSVDYNGDKALVTAMGEGSTVIKVSHPRKVIDLNIYISVSTKESFDKSVTVPSIVEMIVDENKVIQAACTGLSASEKKAITWTIDDPMVADISSDGDVLYLRGRSRNQAWVTVNVPPIGYTKKILLVCKASYDDVMYVFSANETYYRLKAGEQKRVDLIFGSAGFPETERGNIEWIDVENNKVVKIPVSSGVSANVIAENEGIARIRVNHKNNLNVKPLELSFEVYKDSDDPTNYKFVYNSILGLVLDETDELHSQLVSVGIAPQGLGYSQIKWKDEKADDYNGATPVMDVQQTGMGNEFMVTAMAKGQTYLRIEREQVYDPARILVYTADDRAALEAMYPLQLSKQNYLLTVGGQTQDIELKTINDDPDKIKNISWSFSDNNIVNDLSYPLKLGNGDNDRRVRRLSARNPGNCVINISYNGVIIEKVYISVKAANSIDQSKRITSENIIGLKPGTTHTTKLVLSANITADEINFLEWESGDKNVVTVAPVPGNNAAAVLTAVWSGVGERETEVTVSLGQIKRYIKVYVSGDVEQYKAANLDNRYYQLRMGDNFTLSVFHHYHDTKTDDQWRFVTEDNNVVKIDRLNPNIHNKIQITGLNEGVATLELSNPNSSPACIPVRFHIEVSKSAPKIIDNTDDWYLTAIKTVYAVDPSKVFDLARLSVIAVKFPPEEAAKIKWEIIEEYNDEGVLVNYIPEGGSRLIKTPELIEILGNQAGEYIDIRPNNKKGKAVLRVSHAKSANDLQITVWCDVGMIPVVVTPFIETNEEIVKMQINAEKQVMLSVANMYDFDIHGFWIRDANGSQVKEYSDSIIEAKLIANVLMIKGNVFGQTMLTISHDDVPLMQKRVLVLVLSGDSDIVYLTTTQNFNVVQKTEYVTINVDLVGYDDFDNRNFEWINDNPELISINYSGKTAVVRGLDTGTAKIMVFHRYCQYVLNLYVRVTEQTWENPVYVTTPNNIISIKRNESMQVKASLVNGLPQEMTQFQWGTNDRHLIDLQSSGDTALITGKGVGTAMVSIGHPSSLNVVTMLVIVEEIPENLAIYIVSSDSLLVEMSIAETQKRITAHLTGASPQDDFGLQWTISNYSSLVKRPDGQSYQVVNIIANGDTCFIQPVMVTGVGIVEGEAIITVKHPKTSHRLDFKVIVMDQTDIRFQESYITMTQGETKIVQIQTPANRVIRYSSSDSSVVQVDGTNTRCILKAKGDGAAIISAYDVGGTKSDEIIVRVNGITYDRPYINAQTLVLLSRQQPQGTTIKAELRNARDDSVLSNTLNQNLYWTVDNPGIVTFFGGTKHSNYPTTPFNYTTVPFGSQIGIQPGNIGDAVITVRYYAYPYYGPNDQRNHQSYKDYPELANAEAKIYVRVNSSGTSVIIDPSVFNLEWGQPSGRIVTARVTGETGVNYLIGGDIRWESDDETIAKVEQQGGNNNESVALVVPYSAFDSENSNTGPVTIRAIYVKNNTQVDYGTATAMVSPRRLLAFSMGSINIIPGDEITFTSNDPTYKITCYPEDEQLVVSASSNAFFSFTYKESLDGNGKMGRELSIRGSQVEGSGSIILTGKTNGLTAQLLVNNVLNQHIQWQNGKTVYLEPLGSTTKLYLLTPPRYSLRLKSTNVNNSIAVKKIGDFPRDSGGNIKFDAELILTEMETTGHATFNRGYEIESHFENGKSGKYIPIFTIMDGATDAGMGDYELEVIVGYKDVVIDFSGESVNNGAGNKTSVFDKTQSSIRLAGNMGYLSQQSTWLNGLELTITAKSGNNTDTNVTIDWAETKFVLDTAKNDYLGKTLNGSNKIKLYYVTNVQEPNTGPSGTLYKSDYIGVLTVKYKYNTYTRVDVPGEKNFLVYHDRYYR
jgi:plastocyanin